MNKIILSVVLFASSLSAAFADVSADYAENEKSSVLISAELSAAAAQMLGGEMAEQLLHAVRLQMVKYDRDMKTRAGREAWHGRLVSQEIHTNDMVKVEVYSNDVDGAVWRYRIPYRTVTPAASVSAANSRLKTTISTNGVPTRLAAARLRRMNEIEGGVTNVDVTVTAGEAY